MLSQLPKLSLLNMVRQNIVNFYEDNISNYILNCITDELVSNIACFNHPDILTRKKKCSRETSYKKK